MKMNKLFVPIIGTTLISAAALPQVVSCSCGRNNEFAIEVKLDSSVQHISMKVDGTPVSGEKLTITLTASENYHIDENSISVDIKIGETTEKAEHITVAMSEDKKQATISIDGADTKGDLTIHAQSVATIVNGFLDDQGNFVPFKRTVSWYQGDIATFYGNENAIYNAYLDVLKQNPDVYYQDFMCMYSDKAKQQYDDWKEVGFTPTKLEASVEILNFEMDRYFPRVSAVIKYDFEATNKTTGETEVYSANITFTKVHVGQGTLEQTVEGETISIRAFACPYVYRNPPFPPEAVHDWSIEGSLISPMLTIEETKFDYTNCGSEPWDNPNFNGLCEPINLIDAYYFHLIPYPQPTPPSMKI